MQVHWNPNLEKRLREIPRSHPWTSSTEDSRANYVDLRANPQSVREALEDYKPYEDQLGIQRFYDMLLWANGPDSLIETNDCLLRVIDQSSPARAAQATIRGHVTFFFRDLVENCRPSSVVWLCRELERNIRAADPDFAGGAFDYARWPARFRTLRGNDGLPTNGNLVNLRFVANGADEQSAFDNLDRTFETLHIALRETSAAASRLGLG
jgi:hypothetical protein